MHEDVMQTERDGMNEAGNLTPTVPLKAVKSKRPTAGSSTASGSQRAVVVQFCETSKSDEKLTGDQKDVIMQINLEAFVEGAPVNRVA